MLMVSKFKNLFQLLYGYFFNTPPPPHHLEFQKLTKIVKTKGLKNS
jgi:hypothetical protein